MRWHAGAGQGAARGAMADIVRFENVGLRHGVGAEILSGLDLILARGSLHVLTGASGAGKSALAGLATGALRPSRGIVRLFGQDVAALSRSELPALRRRIGVVHQVSRMIDDLSALDNVALPLRIAGMAEGEIAPRVAELLEWVGFGAPAATRAGALAESERRRVAVARAVIAAPEMIVADEPLAGVDRATGDRLLHLIAALNRNGATVLITTHEAAVIDRLPSAVPLHLVRGRLAPAGAAGPRAWAARG